MACSTSCRASVSGGILREHGHLCGQRGPQLAEDPLEDGLVAEVHAAVGARDSDSHRLPSVSMSTSQGSERWPRELDALAPQQRLEGLEPLWPVPDASWSELPLQAERSQQSGDLSHVPLHRMDAIGAIGDVSDAEILAPGQQVLQAHRHHGTERYLERPATQVQITGAAEARVQIDPVATNPHRVSEQLRAVREERMGDVLLDDGELRPETP